VRREPGMKKISKRDREAMAKTVLIRPSGRGKIDPREIRRAVRAVVEERLKEEAKAEARAKADANGKAHPVEPE
jgi:hypothetical protein